MWRAAQPLHARGSTLGCLRDEAERAAQSCSEMRTCCHVPQLLPRLPLGIVHNTPAPRLGLVAGALQGQADSKHKFHALWPPGQAAGPTAPPAYCIAWVQAANRLQRQLQAAQQANVGAVAATHHCGLLMQRVQQQLALLRQ